MEVEENSSHGGRCFSGKSTYFQKKSQQHQQNIMNLKLAAIVPQEVITAADLVTKQILEDVNQKYRENREELNQRIREEQEKP